VLTEAQNLGLADPIGEQRRMATLINEVAKRAVEHAINDGSGGSKSFKADWGVWLRWAGGIMIPLTVLILTAWWTLGGKVAERPTEREVKELIADRKPHPDLKELSMSNARLIQQQAVDLAAIKAGIVSIQSSVNELKKSKDR